MATSKFQKRLFLRALAHEEEIGVGALGQDLSSGVYEEVVTFDRAKRSDGDDEEGVGREVKFLAEAGALVSRWFAVNVRNSGQRVFNQANARLGDAEEIVQGLGLISRDGHEGAGDVYQQAITAFKGFLSSSWLGVTPDE